MRDFFYDPWTITIGSGLAVLIIWNIIGKFKNVSRKKKIIGTITISVIVIVFILVLMFTNREKEPTDPGIWFLDDGRPMLDDDYATNFCDMNLVNCDDYTTQERAQMFYDACRSTGDINRLDSDNDGIACEHLP